VGLASDKAITKGEWSHLAATWIYNETTEETTVKLYVNGAEVSSKTVSGAGPVRDSDGDLLIGSQLPEEYNDDYGHFTFKGLIDEVSLYNHVRTAAEIQADYELFASDI
jgi:MSHA biogenesis protein MshQ